MHVITHKTPERIRGETFHKLISAKSPVLSQAILVNSKVALRNALVFEAVLHSSSQNMQSRCRVHEPHAAHFVTSTIMAWLPVFRP
jgi:hypothetical protein